MKGGVVARGRIRVDARRAVEKLREHQLVDLHHYLHELVRAAVASKAGTVDITYDADDLVISWLGEPWGLSSLPRLLDYVLTEAADVEAQRWRLLAMGVNAALGLEPRFVSVAISDGQSVERWRFAANQLERDAGPERLTPGPKAPAGFVRVQVTRRLGWNVIRRAATRGAPREIPALLAATRDLPVPLSIAGQRRDSARASWALTVPLRIRQAGVQRAELLVASGLTPSVRWLERGVDLAATPLPEVEGLPAGPAHGCRLPVAVVVDADALPTNASRSALRSDASLVREVERAIPGALERAVDALCRAAGMAAAERKSTAVEAKGMEAPKALELLSTMAVLAASASEEGYPRLMKLPLLRGACGEPRTVDDLKAAAVPVGLHCGKEPVDARLAAWMSNVFWRQGGVLDLVFDTTTTTDAGPVVARAEEGRARHARFMGYPEAAVALPPHNDHLVVEAITVTQGPLEGLKGEIAIDGAALIDGREVSSIRVFIHQRELAVVRLRGTPLPLHAAVSWDALTPLSTYDGIEDDEARAAVIRFVARAGSGLVLDLWERARELDEGQRGILRRAVCAALTSAPDITHASGAGLAAIPAWPTLGGEHVSLEDLLSELHRRRGLAWVKRPGPEGTTANGRLVLALDQSHHRWLAELLGEEANLVDYECGIIPPGGTRTHEARLWQRLRAAIAAEPSSDVATVEIRRPGLRALASVSEASRLIHHHAGVRLGSSRVPRLLGGTLAVVEDDTIHPTADWDGVAWSGRTWSFASIEREQLVTLVAALEGDPAARARCRMQDDLGEAGRTYLWRCLVAARSEAEARDEEMEQVVSRLVGLPLVTMLGPEGEPRRVSLAEVERVHGAEVIPWLDEPPGFPTLDWHPLVLSGRQQPLAEQWFGHRLQLATNELGERRAHVEARAERDRLLASQPEEVTALSGVAPDETRHVSYEGNEGAEAPRMELALALVHPESLLISTQVDVGYCGRYFDRIQLPQLAGPLVARLSWGPRATNIDAWIEGWTRLTDAGRQEVTRSVVQGAAALARERLLEDVEAFDDERLVALVESLLVDHGGVCKALRGIVRQRGRFPVAQGTEVDDGWARLGALRRAKGEVYASTKRYATWSEGRGALDRPVLWMPPTSLGVAFQRILAALHIQTRDVTAALRRLHMRRTCALGEEPPELRGEPPGPGLRIDLDVVDAHDDLVGQLELGVDRSSLRVHDLSGEIRSIPWSPFVPLRAVVRWDAVPSEAVDNRLRRRLEGAGRRFVARLATRDDELTTLGRRAVRSLVGERLRQGKRLSKTLREAEVFEDTTGDLHSFEAMAAGASTLWFTTGLPPYPERKRPILRLTTEEQAWLRPQLSRTLRDMTALLQREVTAKERKARAPRKEMRLRRESARRSALRLTIDQDDLRGELGILPPGDDRGGEVEVHVEGRPLCTLASPDFVGVIDVALAPNRFFDGFRRLADGRVLEARLRVRADQALRDHLVAPVEAATEHWVDVTSKEGARLRGRFWFPSRVLQGSSVEVWGPGMNQPAAVSLIHLAATARLDRSVPIGGRLWLSGGDEEGDLHHFVVQQALVAAAAMLAKSATGFDDQGYRWTMALMGVELEELPSAVLASGATIGPDEVLDALRTEEVVWFAEGRGEADGDFPAELPPFVLRRGGDSGLIDVLARRATGGWLRELGGFASASSPPVFDATELFATPPVVARKHDPRRMASTASETSTMQPEAVVEELVDPFWSGVNRRLRGWFGDPPAPAPASTDLRSALERRLSELPLPADTVRSVGFSRRGRAVRYEPGRRRVVLHRDHPWIRRWLGVGQEVSDDGIERVVAAALSEINRAEEMVNRAVELEAILALLEQR